MIPNRSHESLRSLSMTAPSRAGCRKL